MSVDIVSMIKAAGFEVVEGHDNTLSAIAAASDGSTKALCSGYRVFPGGEKCPGCTDCEAKP